MAVAGVRYIQAMRRILERRAKVALSQADPRTDVDEPGRVLRLSLGALVGMISVQETEIPDDLVVTAGMLGRYGDLVVRKTENDTRRFLRRPLLTSVDPARGYEGLTRAWADEAASRIKIIAEDYRSRVSALIEKGYTEGWGTERIAKAIEAIGAATENRSRLWARDQIATINAQATERAQSKAGVTHYMWSTSRDEAVRDEQEPGQNHVEREGVIYAWDSPPRENRYDGHPGEPINCFPGGVRVSASGVCKVYRRHYEGPLVRLYTKRGSFEVTPNHPVMTSRGWLPAGDIKPGDHLVELVRDQLCAENDDDDVPTFDQLWDLAHGVRLRLATGAGFHGDASPSDDVDVVLVDWDLVGHGDPLTPKLLQQLDLAEADDPASASSALDKLRMAALPPPDRVVGGRDASEAILGRHALLHDVHSLGSAANRDASIAEPSHDDVARDADAAGQRQNAFAGAVRFDEVVEVVRSRHFVGHVYNLQTLSGAYLVSSLNAVAHNCRCVAIPVLPDELDDALAEQAARGSLPPYAAT